MADGKWPDFNDLDFDPEEWVSDMVKPAEFGKAFVRLLDRPVQTTTEGGKSVTVVSFEGQEYEALQALAERLRG